MHSDCRNANPSFFFTCSSHSLDGYANTGPPPPPPAPLIPSAQTAFASPPGGPMSPGPMAGLVGYAPPLPTLSGAHAAPPPPGPPPPPLPAGASHLTTRKMSSSAPAETAVVNDARSDLLAAIRMGKDLCPPVLLGEAQRDHTGFFSVFSCRHPAEKGAGATRAAG